MLLADDRFKWLIALCVTVIFAVAGWTWAARGEMARAEESTIRKQYDFILSDIKKDVDRNTDLIGPLITESRIQSNDIKNISDLVGKIWEQMQSGGKQ
jgi:hypothetical protein